MSGVLGLHGGDEFQPGDEPFLAALLEAARPAAGVDPVHIAIVPTAAGRGRPDLAASHGIAAFERVAAALGVDVQVEAVPVIDAASAADPALAARLTRAHVTYLPGGDPDLIPRVFPGSPTWAALRDAHEVGAVLAGASAGAMALAAWTWTPAGLVAGLGLVPGVLVVPHADARSWDRSVERFGHQRPPNIGLLGLPERTGIVRHDDGRWQVVGAGTVRWLPPGPGAVVELWHPGERRSLDLA